MARALHLLNGFAVVFSGVWLVGHSTVRVFDWEFWFALGYTVLAALNFARGARGAGGGEPGDGQRRP